MTISKKTMPSGTAILFFHIRTLYRHVSEAGKPQQEFG
jgi:hypothetical protein